MWPKLRVSSSPISAGADLPGFGSGSPSIISANPFLTLQCSLPPPLLCRLGDPVVILLDSSGLLLLTRLLTSRILLQIPLAGDAGVAFNPFHLCPWSRLCCVLWTCFCPLPLILSLYITAPTPPPPSPSLPVIPIFLPSSESCSHCQRSGAEEKRKGEGASIRNLSSLCTPL